MKEYRRYNTSLYVPYDKVLEKSRVEGKGWYLDFKPFKEYHNDDRKTVEVIICATDYSIAQDTANLIHMCYVLINGSVSFCTKKYDFISVLREDFLEWSNENGSPDDWLKNMRKYEKSFHQCNNYTVYENASTAFLLASEVSRGRRYNLAMSRYNLVCNIVITHSFYWDFDYNPRISNYFDDQIVKHTTCIGLVHDALLDLGIIDRGIKAQPADIEKNMDAIKERFVVLGINPYEKIMWHEVAKVKKDESVENTGTRIPEFQENEISLLEAVSKTKSLHEYISSSDIVSVKPVLTHYNVINTEVLLRRIILEATRIAGEIEKLRMPPLDADNSRNG